jgi:hypothetical protein
MSRRQVRQRLRVRNAVHAVRLSHSPYLLHPPTCLSGTQLPAICCLLDYLPSHSIAVLSTSVIWFAMASLALYAAVLLVSVLSLYVFRVYAAKSSLPLPPGPPALPIIGNVHQAPKSHPWLQYHAWGKTYGPVVHLNMMGQPVIILSTSAAAHDLLAKRGATFSDRPRFVVRFF